MGAQARNLTIALSCLLVAGAARAGERDYLTAVKAYADVMIEYGTDHYGPQHTPQFAGMLIRTDPPALPPDPVFPPPGSKTDERLVLNLPNIFKGSNLAHKVTYRGGDVGDDAGLYQLLYRLSEVTGNPKYSKAADASLAWFLAHAPMKETGLLPWGEHTGWDFRREHYDHGYPFDNRHEFDSRWPLWEKFVELQPKPAPGELTVLERFAKAIWLGAVGHQKGKLVYGRHSYLLSNTRPTEGEWAHYGMFPRHGGYYIELWAVTRQSSKNEEFRRWMAGRLSEFVKALEDQIREYGYPIYSDGKGDVRYAPSQISSMAVDLDDAAKRLSRSEPALAQRLRSLAGRIDDSLMEKKAELLPAVARSRWRNAATDTRRAYYRAEFFRAVDAIAAQPSLKERPLGAKARKVTQPGRIPEQYAQAIQALLLGAEATGGEKRKYYLARANHFAREAMGRFLDDDCPLPKSLDRQPVLLDGTPFPDFYQSYLGGDDLMWALLELHEANRSILK
jgi:hypothetical protein